MALNIVLDQESALRSLDGVMDNTPQVMLGSFAGALNPVPM